ncbi:MAG: hypothetical protein ACYSWQ_18845 [Planctomycetota bacterium]
MIAIFANVHPLKRTAYFSRIYDTRFAGQIQPRWLFPAHKRAFEEDHLAVAVDHG